MGNFVENYPQRLSKSRLGEMKQVAFSKTRNFRKGFRNGLIHRFQIPAWGNL